MPVTRPRTSCRHSALGTCVSLPADVSTSEGVEDLVARYREHESSLDVLVNNAGAAWGAEFDTFREHGWDKVMDLNVKTPFFLTQALKPDLVAEIGRAHDRTPVTLPPHMPSSD